ncbi:MAG: GTP-binding protein [Candidatus Solibacter sp.]|jgi:hypothetical protein
MTTAKPLILLVGGFLGSGKTTLLLEIAGRLSRSGSRVALITNDQGGELVDTRLATTAGTETEEVTGGCFCCRFSDLIASAERLRAHNPDIILAEPVGSCMDIAATVLQPIQRYYGDRYRLAPFTVLVDPRRARQLLSPDADPDLAYLFNNQLQEADLVCFSKADVNTDFPALPSGFALRVSAATGEGVREWLEEVLVGSSVPGSRLLHQVDYRRYAEAEAAMGWLNWRATLDLTLPVSPSEIVGPLLDDLDQALTLATIEIAHLKVFDQASTGYVKASLCRNGEEPTVHGALDASPAQRHDVLLNLRACGDPELMKLIVNHSTGKLPGPTTLVHFEAFRFSPPKPEHRITLL